VRATCYFNASVFCKTIQQATGHTHTGTGHTDRENTPDTGTERTVTGQPQEAIRRRQRLGENRRRAGATVKHTYIYDGFGSTYAPTCSYTYLALPWSLAFTRYCFTSKLYCGSPSFFYCPPPTCKAYPIAILLHDHCAINAPPATPPLNAIHHTIWVMAISCKV